MMISSIQTCVNTVYYTNKSDSVLYHLSSSYRFPVYLLFSETFVVETNCLLFLFLWPVYLSPAAFPMSILSTLVLMQADSLTAECNASYEKLFLLSYIHLLLVFRKRLMKKNIAVSGCEGILLHIRLIKVLLSMSDLHSFFNWGEWVESYRTANLQFTAALLASWYVSCFCKIAKWWEITRYFVSAAVTSTCLHMTGRDALYHSYHKPSHRCTLYTALLQTCQLFCSVINDLCGLLCCTMELLALMVCYPTDFVCYAC